MFGGVAAGVVFGDMHGLVHQLLRGDAAAGERVVADDKDRLLKNTGVRGIDHDDPSGNTLNQEFALLCPVIFPVFPDEKKLYFLFAVLL